jgi:hypothetical protein
MTKYSKPRIMRCIKLAQTTLGARFIAFEKAVGLVKIVSPYGGTGNGALQTEKIAQIIFLLL